MKESFAFYADFSWFVSNLESACQVNVWYFIIIIFFCGHDESMNLKSEDYLFHIFVFKNKGSLSSPYYSEILFVLFGFIL